MQSKKLSQRFPLVKRPKPIQLDENLLNPLGTIYNSTEFFDLNFAQFKTSSRTKLRSLLPFDVPSSNYRRSGLMTTSNILRSPSPQLDILQINENIKRTATSSNKCSLNRNIKIGLNSLQPAQPPTNASPRIALQPRKSYSLLKELSLGIVQLQNHEQLLVSNTKESKKGSQEVKSHRLLDSESKNSCKQARRLSHNDYFAQTLNQLNSNRVESTEKRASPRLKKQPARLRSELKNSSTYYYFEKRPQTRLSLDKCELRDSIKSGIPSMQEIYKERIAANFEEFFSQGVLSQEHLNRSQSTSIARLDTARLRSSKVTHKRKNSDASIADELNSNEKDEETGFNVVVSTQATSLFQLKSDEKLHSRTSSVLAKSSLKKHGSKCILTQSTKKFGVADSLTLQSPPKVTSSTCESASNVKNNTYAKFTEDKAQKISHPTKKLWTQENDKHLEILEAQALEKIPAITFISSSQNELNEIDAKPSEFCQTFSLRSVNAIEELVLKPGKRDYKVVRKALINAVKYMLLLKLDPKEISNKKVFSSEPYEKEGSRELIRAVKMGDLMSVEMLLLQNKYLVYDFDNIHQTALHWAAKRGHKEIAAALINNGSDLNVKDLLGRTPLFYAIHLNNIEILKLLLKARCDPWSTSKINYTEMVRYKPLAKYYLSKCRQIHIMMAMTPTKHENDLWMKESLVLALDPINLPMTSID